MSDTSSVNAGPVAAIREYLQRFREDVIKRRVEIAVLEGQIAQEQANIAVMDEQIAGIERTLQDIESGKISTVTEASK